MNLLKLTTFLLILLLTIGCKHKQPTSPADASPTFSLAQWTYHKALFAGDMTTFDFIKKARELEFEGVEFVNQFFKDKATDGKYLDSLRAQLRASDMAAVMIMVDGEGHLGDPDSTARTLAVENHKKWIDAANHIEAPYIRVNAHSTGTAQEAMEACLFSLTALAAYAETQEVTILVENHGGYSSDGDWLSQLLSSLAPVGVHCLADFDNWCIERENGQLWGAPCTNRYNTLKGMKQVLPYAKGLSIKSFNFDSEGEETRINYKELVAEVKKSGYNGYFGIEYEGDNHPVEQGIQSTRELVIKHY